MKRLLSMLLTFIMAVTNDLPYQLNDYMQPYSDDSYYKIDVSAAPNYRTMYDYGFIPDTGDHYCRTPNVSGSAEKVKNTSANGYWFVDSVSLDKDELPKTADVWKFNGSAGTYVICPFDAILETSSTGQPVDMTIRVKRDGLEFVITITNLERWWCCLRRVDPVILEGDSAAWLHTGGDHKGHTFHGGDVLGIASDDTEIKVSLVGASTSYVSMHDLYTLYK